MNPRIGGTIELRPAFAASVAAALLTMPAGAFGQAGPAEGSPSPSSFRYERRDHDRPADKDDLGPSWRHVVGMTVPYETATLASVQPARVARINFPEGAAVAAGDVVVQLDDAVQATRTRIARATSETSLNIDHARASWERAQRDLDRLMRLHGNDQASSKELSDAVADEQITKIEYDLAHFNQAQAVRTFERERASLEEYSLKSPFDGYVAQHHKHAGEGVNEIEGIVTLVQLHPLKVLADCSMEQAASLHAGEKYRVRPVDGGRPPRMGTVILVSRVADAGSQTVKIKLAVDNADAAWISGMKVVIDFSAVVQSGDAVGLVPPPANHD